MVKRKQIQPTNPAAKAASKSQGEVTSRKTMGWRKFARKTMGRRAAP
jgi:hypothetical protein